MLSAWPGLTCAVYGDTYHLNYVPRSLHYCHDFSSLSNIFKYMTFDDNAKDGLDRFESKILIAVEVSGLLLLSIYLYVEYAGKERQYVSVQKKKDNNKTMVDCKI